MTGRGDRWREVGDALKLDATFPRSGALTHPQRC